MAKKDSEKFRVEFHYYKDQRIKRRQRKRNIEKVAIIVSVFLIFLCLSGVIIKEMFFPDVDNYTAEKGEIDAEVLKNLPKADNEKKRIESSARITLLENGDLQINLGDPFTDHGYTAEDEDGTDLTSQVKVDASALNRAGDQEVIYTVMGNNNVEAKEVRPVKVLPNTEYATQGLPICMYHYVYDPASPPENIDSNFISTNALAEEMKYLHENGYYFPTWQEVRDYVEGKLLLPEKSIVLTFDDGPNYMYLGTPILEQYETPATSFVIASYWNSRDMLYGYASDYLTFQSHSYQMHQGGGSIGHGGIYTAMSKEEILSDLQKSFDICGNSDAFAYPFGDYTEEGCAVLEKAGLLCAVTTENAKAFPGDNPYLLPRVRMLGTQTLDEFIAVIQ